MKPARYLFMIFILTIQKLASFGQAPAKQWDYRYGGAGNDYLISFDLTTDGGYILGGESYSGIGGDKSQDTHNASWDFWIIKIDSAGTKQWDVDFGGINLEELTCVHQTSDGGYIAGGITYSGSNGDVSQSNRGHADYWLLKMDDNGSKQWDVRFGGGKDDFLYSAEQTKDGGYILGGGTYSGMDGDITQPGKGGEDYWIVKTDAHGVKQWDARYGGNSNEELSTIHQTSDGGYIIGGNTSSPASGDITQENFGIWDYWILKTDSNGIRQWDSRFGGSDIDWFTDTQQTLDGGYLMGGSARSPISGNKTVDCRGSYDYWIVKMDANGNKLWDNRYGGDNDDEFRSLQQTSDGGYILGGLSLSQISFEKSQLTRGGYDYWIVKTDADGNKQWDEDFGSEITDNFSLVRETKDHGLLLGGYTAGISGDKTQDSRGGADFWIVKTNPIVVTCETPQQEFASAIKSTSAKVNWAAVAGAQTYRVQYRISGTQPWTKVSTASTTKKLNGLSPDTQYDWEVKSVCDPVANFSSDWSTIQNFTTKPLRLETEDDDQLLSMALYPNPVSTTATISFYLQQDSKIVINFLAIDGKKLVTIADENFSAGNNEMFFQRNNIPSGLYYLQLISESGMQTIKVVIE